MRKWFLSLKMHCLSEGSLIFFPELFQVSVLFFWLLFINYLFLLF